MTDKTTYMIAHSATVTVIRDGKRIPILAGGGFDFTDKEIQSVLRAQPGALRLPVNEGRGKKVEEDEGSSVKTAKASKGKASKGKAKDAKVEKTPPAGTDADEDEDI